MLTRKQFWKFWAIYSAFAWLFAALMFLSLIFAWSSLSLFASPVLLALIGLLGFQWCNDLETLPMTVLASIGIPAIGCWLPDFFLSGKFFEIVQALPVIVLPALGAGALTLSVASKIALPHLQKEVHEQ